MFYLYYNKQYFNVKHFLVTVSKLYPLTQKSRPSRDEISLPLVLLVFTDFTASTAFIASYCILLLVYRDSVDLDLLSVDIDNNASFSVYHLLAYQIRLVGSCSDRHGFCLYLEHLS